MVTNLLFLGVYVPGIGVYLSLLSVAGCLIWYTLVARILIGPGWGGAQKESS